MTRSRETIRTCRDNQPTTPLEAAACQAGATLRRLAPEATSALIDRSARIISVFAGDNEIDTTDGTGPFDCETLGEADEILRRALAEAAPDAPVTAGWQFAPNVQSAPLYRITFPAHE